MTQKTLFDFEENRIVPFNQNPVASIDGALPVLAETRAGCLDGLRPAVPDGGAVEVTPDSPDDPDGQEAEDTEQDLAVRVDDGSAWVTDDWEGEYISTSWGYGQTNVNIAQIVEVSDTGKTVVCRMATKSVENRGKGSNSVAPGGEVYGDRFRLHVREGYKGEPSFRGSYPYIDGETDTGQRKGSFRRHTGTMHETPTGYGH